MARWLHGGGKAEAEAASVTRGPARSSSLQRHCSAFVLSRLGPRLVSGNRMEARARRTSDSRLAILVGEVVAHEKRLFRCCSGCRETFVVRTIISSAENGFERRVTQADRVTGAEAAGAKAVAASVTGARCAPNAEFRCRMVRRRWVHVRVKNGNDG